MTSFTCDKIEHWTDMETKQRHAHERNRRMYSDLYLYDGYKLANNVNNESFEWVNSFIATHTLYKNAYLLIRLQANHWLAKAAQLTGQNSMPRLLGVVTFWTRTLPATAWDWYISLFIYSHLRHFCYLRKSVCVCVCVHCELLLLLFGIPTCTNVCFRLSTAILLIKCNAA